MRCKTNQKYKKKHKHTLVDHFITKQVKGRKLNDAQSMSTKTTLCIKQVIASNKQTLLQAVT